MYLNISYTITFQGSYPLDALTYYDHDEHSAHVMTALVPWSRIC